MAIFGLLQFTLFILLTYSFIMLLVKNAHRRKMVKMMIDNNLINDNFSGDFKFSFNTEDVPSLKKRILPISLGLMGFALGLFLSIYLLPLFSFLKDIDMFEFAKVVVLCGCPLFFSSLGLLVSYFVERKENK